MADKKRKKGESEAAYRRRLQSEGVSSSEINTLVAQIAFSASDTGGSYGCASSSYDTGSSSSYDSGSSSSSSSCGGGGE